MPSVWYGLLEPPLPHTQQDQAVVHNRPIVHMMISTRVAIWQSSPQAGQMRGKLALLVTCLMALAPAAAVAHPPAAPGSVAVQTGSPYVWPLAAEPRVTRWFDPPPRPWLPGHRGVDLVADPGATVRAAGPGVVHFAGPVAGVGVVSVDHPGGLRTTYQPVTPSVSAGDAVAAGDLIGVLDAGHPGCPVAACLHWGLRRGATYLDPLALLGIGRVRLLPRPD